MKAKNKVYFIESLNNENKAFMSALLGMAKAKEKKDMSEDQLNDENDAINAKNF